MREVLGKIFRNVLNVMSMRFSFAGSEYVGARTVLSAENVLTAAGLGATYKFSIMAVRADLTLVPETGDIVTIEGVEYAVLNSQIDPAAVSIRFDLGGKYS